MVNFGIVAVLSTIFLIALWLLWRIRTGGGSGGPVIIITPPPDAKNTAKILYWKLLVDDKEQKIDFDVAYDGTIPAALMEGVYVVEVTPNKGGSTIINSGFRELTLELASGDKIVLSNDKGRYKWADGDNTWGSGGTQIFQWPTTLQAPVTQMTFVDLKKREFTFRDIGEIKLGVSKPK